MEPVAPLHFDPARSTEDLIEEIERWVTAPPLRALVDEFGGPDVAVSGDLASRMAALAEFSEVWDFRRGAERNLAEHGEFSAAQAALVMDAADALGLVSSPAPRYDRYDHVVVLGGLIRASILRPRLAASLLAGSITASTVTGIGAFRPLGGDEPSLAAEAGFGDVRTEFDAMIAGMEAAFELRAPVSVRGSQHPENPNLSWSVQSYEAAEGPAVTVVAAPTTDPARRANTPDSYRYLAEELVRIERGHRVLAVTSAIYLPFQLPDAIRMLGLTYGAVVDAVGVDTTSVDTPSLRQTFTPANYLQEIRSALLSLRSLHAAASNL
jgi:hypothetical protein